MKTKIFLILFILVLNSKIYSQNITNTLGNNGTFYIKNGSDTLFILKESDGFLGLGKVPTEQLELSKNFKLPVTVDSIAGVIYKGSDRFIHNYSVPATFGNNSFFGIKSGTFQITAFDIHEGSNNTGVGTNTLSSLRRGFLNTALGSDALQNNTNGNLNSAVGTNSLASNNTGIGNSALGSNSLVSNTTGGYNVSVGTNCLSGNTTGNFNTVLGGNAGTNLISGSNNIIIGNTAQPTTSSVSNQITLGNNLITSLRCNVQSITSLSDMRDKKNISELTLGMDFISKLKPRQFNWDKREWYDNNKSDGSKAEDKLNAGFIAQELDEVQTNENAEWLGLVNKDNPEKIEATYGNLLPVIVKAMQELKDENDILKARVNELTNKLNSLSEKNIQVNYKK